MNAQSLPVVSGEADSIVCSECDGSSTSTPLVTVSSI